MPALLESELPVRARVRHHWITMFRQPPHPVLTVALVVLVIAAIGEPNPMVWVLLAVLLAAGFLRWQTWSAEWILLTGKRIIRVQGVPETTSTEASLRIDRISGAVLIKTVPGKIFGYGSIHLEAPGDHPDLRRLRRIADPDKFYLVLRSMIFGDRRSFDPDNQWTDFVTEPLPPGTDPEESGPPGRHRQP